MKAIKRLRATSIKLIFRFTKGSVVFEVNLSGSGRNKNP